MTHPTLTELLDHLRDPDPHRQLHIEGCDRCRAAIEELDDELSLLVTDEPPPLSADQAAVLVGLAVDDVLGPAPRVATRRPSVGPWLLAALVLLFVGVGWAMVVLRPLPAPAPPPPHVLQPAPAPAPPTPVADPVPAPRPAPRSPEPSAPVEEPEVEPPAVEAPAPPASDSLFREAVEALANQDPVTAQVLLELLIEIHPDMDIRTLQLAEEGLSLRVDDATAAAARFRAAYDLAPQGPLAADVRQWLCEIVPTDPRCQG